MGATSKVHVEWLTSYDSWKVRTRNVPDNDVYKDTKAKAVKRARKIAKRNNALLVIKKKNGGISNQVNYE